MKKKIILLFFILIMLSGCVKSTTTMKISPTKSINFESDFLISNCYYLISYLHCKDTTFI